MGNRQKRASRGKSLAELISSGNYRPDRHWKLVLEGERPEGVDAEEWASVVNQAREYLSKKTGEERRRAEKLLGQSSGSYDGPEVPEGYSCPHTQSGYACPFLLPLVGYVPPSYAALWRAKVEEVLAANTCLGPHPDLATA